MEVTRFLPGSPLTASLVLCSLATAVPVIAFSATPDSGSPSYSISASPNPAAPGQTITFTGSVDPGVSASGARVTLWFYNSSGGYVGSASQTGLTFTAGHPTPITIARPNPTSTAVDTYTYNLSVYNTSGSGLWGKVNAGSFAVANSSSSASLNLVCNSAVVVGLKWSAVSGATRYTLSRDNNVLTPSGGISYRSWADQTVAANTTYTYKLAALSSNGATVSSGNLKVVTHAASPSGDAAYCPSTVIPSMTVQWSSGVNQQNGSDLWSQTLGTDGNEYGFFGDGVGFGGSDSDSQDKVSWGIGAIASHTGGDLSTAFNVYGGAKARHPAFISGKATSVLAVGADFYAIGGVSSTTSNHTFGGPTHQEIAYSISNAWSWHSNQSNWTFCTDKSTPGTFCPGTFLQNGAGYAGNTDGFVYIYGGTVHDFFGNGTPGLYNAYLWRVKSNDILTQSYEAFTGLDANGNPTWKGGDFATLSKVMKPVYTDRGPRVLPLSAVVYNAALKRYIASAESAVNQVAFYEAPNPWGPWAAIGYFNSNRSDNSGGWGNLGAGLTWQPDHHGDGLGINFVDKWTSSDGKTMWIVFASNGAASSSADLVPLRGKDMDSFSAVAVTLNTSH